MDDPVAEDHVLVAAARQDRAAFANLYRKYTVPVYRYFYGQLGNLPDAEDLTATTFGKAFAGLAGYRGEGQFAAWLFGIAHHTLLDFRRAHRVEMDLTEVAPLL